MSKATTHRRRMTPAEKVLCLKYYRLGHSYRAIAAASGFSDMAVRGAIPDDERRSNPNTARHLQATAAANPIRHTDFAGAPKPVAPAPKPESDCASSFEAKERAKTVAATQALFELLHEHHPEQYRRPTA
ncbi:MAG: hypothetical protein AB7O39_03295 [Flavobacteriaceae bacterium]